MLPKEVYPLIVMVGGTCAGSVAFLLHSVFKRDVYFRKEKRTALFK